MVPRGCACEGIAAITDYDLSIAADRKGDRVELHPATDAWMRGDRFGEVTTVGRTLVHVQMDRSGKVRPMYPENVGKVY